MTKVEREAFRRGLELGRRQGRDELLRTLRELLNVPSMDDLDSYEIRSDL